MSFYPLGLDTFQDCNLVIVLFSSDLRWRSCSWQSTPSLDAVALLKGTARSSRTQDLWQKFHQVSPFLPLLMQMKVILLEGLSLHQWIVFFSADRILQRNRENLPSDEQLSNSLSSESLEKKRRKKKLLLNYKVARKLIGFNWVLLYITMVLARNWVNSCVDGTRHADYDQAWSEGICLLFEDEIKNYGYTLLHMLLQAKKRAS